MVRASANRYAGGFSVSYWDGNPGSPLAGLGRLLSATEDPVMTNPLIVTGGDVIEYAPGSNGAIRSPALRSTRPSRPKPAQGRPSFASSAMS